jgi:hypothetical protein
MAEAREGFTSCSPMTRPEEEASLGQGPAVAAGVEESVSLRIRLEGSLVEMSRCGEGLEMTLLGTQTR